MLLRAPFPTFSSEVIGRYRRKDFKGWFESKRLFISKVLEVWWCKGVVWGSGGPTTSGLGWMTLAADLVPSLALTAGELL